MTDRIGWRAMMSHVLSNSPRRHLPLRQAALCLDCEECFELGTAACPVCGSEIWTLLTRVLREQHRLAGPARAAYPTVGSLREGNGTTPRDEVREKRAL